MNGCNHIPWQRQLLNEQMLPYSRVEANVLEAMLPYSRVEAKVNEEMLPCSKVGENVN